MLALAFPFFIALAVTASSFESYTMPGESMVPLLCPGDRFLVQSHAYNARYLPQRGDVVAFKNPKHPLQRYTKRIIGMPGETIQFKAGGLFIGRIEMPKLRVKGFPVIGKDGKGRRLPQYRETLPEGKHIHVLDLAPDTALDDTPLFIVPPNAYFVLGDNRDSSLDSRSKEIGFIPADHIIGKVRLKIWNGFTDRIQLRWIK